VSAILIAFPIVRRQDLVRRIAEQMLARSEILAEKHLQCQLNRQRSKLKRKQITDDVIEQQIAAFEAAVRAQLWRLVLLPTRPTGGAH